MCDVINLRRVRKAKKRSTDENRAAANRAKDGQFNADKHLASMAKQMLDAIVFGARRNKTDD